MVYWFGTVVLMKPQSHLKVIRSNVGCSKCLSRPTRRMVLPHPGHGGGKRALRLLLLLPGRQASLKAAVGGARLCLRLSVTS